MFDEPRTEESLPAEEQHEHHSGNNRGHRERQIDQRDQQLPAAELKLADGPGSGHAKDQIRRYSNGGSRQRQRQCSPRVRLGNRVHVCTPSEPKRLREDGDQWYCKKKEQEAERYESEQPPDGRRLGQSLSGIARASRLDVCHQFVSLRLLQPWSALTVR